VLSVTLLAGCDTDSNGPTSPSRSGLDPTFDVTASPGTLFLHGTGATANPATLFLDAVAPTGATAKYKDSPSIRFSGGNPYTAVGTWTAAPAVVSGSVTALGPAHVWLGLKNSDDIGTRFDVRVEAYKNSTLVASGETPCIQGLTQNSNLAKDVAISFDPFPAADFNGTSDVFSLKVLTRIGTTASGALCGGHSSAVGLRLYFDATSRAANVAMTIAPTQPEFTSVSSGLYHTCSRVSDGTARCWGDDSYGQAPASQAPPLGTTFTQVSAGAFHTCAGVSNGTVGCWGHNVYGEAPASQAPPAGTSFIQVSGGGTHTCALVSDGTFGCWGDNFYGETPSSQAPPPGTTFIEVSAGGTQTCVLKGDGTVGCWGDNTYGQSPASQAPPEGTTFTQVSSGYFHTCALVSDGTVSCWGGNFYGETASPLPPPGTTFTQVSATLYHTCALVSDGSVRCWGNNADGFAPPTQAPPSGTTFTQVAAAFTHQCALMSDGRVGCWGGMIGQTPGFHIFTP
jgi:alpha-tubulin suppressor-like RCC1 family protein